ncbi:MAG: molybdopterin-binding protein [Spirochaetes bacterium]|nr:molybdopterin-binding protein [Spirochaetota bacterium]
MAKPVNEAVIIPTGGEIKDGTVLDTNSPAVMFSLISMNPLCIVHRAAPVDDDAKEIAAAVEKWIERGVGLVVLIGGSGGGRVYDSSLSEDFTHGALESLLEKKSVREIWGKNGHLWCKLVCGEKNGTLVINVPGPYVEAKAAIEAFCQAYRQAYSENPVGLSQINSAMARAVLEQFPENELRE